MQASATHNSSAASPDSGPTASAAAPAPFYELRFTTHAGDEEYSQWTTWYVPSRTVARVRRRANEGVSWTRIDDPKLTALATRVKPFPTPVRITAVTIGSRNVTEDPSSYLRLFSVESTGDARAAGLADWEPIVFRANERRPRGRWLRSSLFFSPSNGMLQRGIEIVELPIDMAADVRSGESLSGGGSSFPWPTVLFALLAAAAVLIAASMIRPLRRRVFVRRAPATA